MFAAHHLCNIKDWRGRPTSALLKQRNIYLLVILKYKQLNTKYKCQTLIYDTALIKTRNKS